MEALEDRLYAMALHPCWAVFPNSPLPSLSHKSPGISHLEVGNPEPYSQFKTCGPSEGITGGAPQLPLPERFPNTMCFLTESMYSEVAHFTTTLSGLLDLLFPFAFLKNHFCFIYFLNSSLGDLLSLQGLTESFSTHVNFQNKMKYRSCAKVVYVVMFSHWHQWTVEGCNC